MAWTFLNVRWNSNGLINTCLNESSCFVFKEDCEYIPQVLLSLCQREATSLCGACTPVIGDFSNQIRSLRLKLKNEGQILRPSLTIILTGIVIKFIRAEDIKILMNRMNQISKGIQFKGVNITICKDPEVDTCNRISNSTTFISILYKTFYIYSSDCNLPTMNVVVTRFEIEMFCSGGGFLSVAQWF